MPKKKRQKLETQISKTGKKGNYKWCYFQWINYMGLLQRKSWRLRWQIPTNCSPHHFPSASKYEASWQFPSSLAIRSGHGTGRKWWAQLSCLVYKTSPMILLHILFPRLLPLTPRTTLEAPLEESRVSVGLETSKSLQRQDSDPFIPPFSIMPSLIHLTHTRACTNVLTPMSKLCEQEVSFYCVMSPRFCCLAITNSRISEAEVTTKQQGIYLKDTM